jgi:hypothetical protein
VGQPGRRVFSLNADGRVVGGDGFRGLLCSCRVPGARAEPRRCGILSVAVQGIVDGEQAERTARLLDFVDVAGIQSHRDGVRFVGGGIPELAVNQDCNWDQRSLTTRRKLEQSDGAGAGILLPGCPAFSGDNLRPLLLRIGKLRNASQQRQEKKCEV